MTNDFSKGKVWKNIIYQAFPLILAQLVQLLYNVVDRVYIGHLSGTDGLALTGIGLVFPLTTLIAAFTYLFSTGGTPLFSIARGAKAEERAEKILGNTFSLLWVRRLSCFCCVISPAGLCCTCSEPVMIRMCMQMLICVFICSEPLFPCSQQV